MAEVGSAFVSIMPSAKGFGSKLNSQVGGEVGASGKKMGGIFGKAMLGVVGGIVAGGAILGKFTADAATLDTKMREVVTLFGETGKAADRSLGQVQSQVRNLSSQFGIAQETLTGGLYQAISAGVPRENAFTFMQVASKAAIGGVTDVETAVDGISTTINAFGLSAKDAAAVSDSMFTAVKGGKTTFAELSDSLFNIAPAAAAAGVSFKEVNAGIAALTAGGTPTTVATTQMRAALDGLQKPSADLDAIFGKLGFKNAQLAIESKGLGFALDAVKDASKGNNGELQKLLGSSEAVAAANVLAGTGAKKFADEMRNQAKAAGATKDAFNVVNEGAARQFEIFKTNLRNLGLQVGQALLPVVTSVLKFVNNDLGPAFQRVKLVLEPAVEAFKDVFGQVRAGIQGVIAAFGGGGGGGLMAAFQSIGAFITSSVVPAFMGIVSAVQGYVTVALPIVQAFVAGMRARIEPMLPTIRAVFTQIGSVITGVMGLVQAVIQRVTAIVGSIWSRWGTQIMNFTAKAFNGALTIISGALRVIQGVIKTVTSIIKGDWSGAWNGIKMILSGVWTAIKGIVSLGLTLIKTAIKLAWAAVKALTSAAWDGIKAAVKAGIGKVISDIKAFPGQAKAALGNLGSVLFNAGRDLIQGLIDGVQSALGSLKSKLGEVTNLIPQWKGPPDKDKELLKPAGRSIMQGLIDGLTDRLSDLRSTLSSITDTVSGAFTSDAFGGTMDEFFKTLRGDIHSLGDAKVALGEFESMGLSKAFISSLMQSGNAELIRSLMFDPTAARRGDRLFRKQANLAGDLGSAVGQSVVGQEVRGVRTELRELRKDVQSLAKNIGREINGVGATAQRRRTA